MHVIFQKLAGTDRRSIGRSNKVVSDVLAEPALLKEVFSGMVSGDPVIRMNSPVFYLRVSASL